MRFNRPSKLRVLLVTLIVSMTLVLGQARRADAYYIPGLTEVTAVIALAATYAAVMGVVCTPVATVQSFDHPGGFSGAFGDCFGFNSEDQQQTSIENNRSDKPSDAHEEDEEDYRHDD